MQGEGHGEGQRPVRQAAGRGLRKSAANNLAKAFGKADSSPPGKAGRKAVAELRSLVADLEDRAKGGPAKRQAAAKKAAATRKRKANQRSAAAKKAARTARALQVAHDSALAVGRGYTYAHVDRQPAQQLRGGRRRPRVAGP